MKKDFKETYEISARIGAARITTKIRTIVK